MHRGQPQAVVLVGQDTGDFDHWIASELQRYVLKLSGAELRVAAHNTMPGAGAVIALGTPESNQLIAKAQELGLVDFSVLKPESLILKTLEMEGRHVLIAGGSDETGAMYAVYELLERMGIVFQVANDIIPERKDDLLLPMLEVRMEPQFKHRGWQYWPNIRWNMSLEDYRNQIDQMAKMKMNTLKIFMRMGALWNEFSFNGQTAQIQGRAGSKFLAFVTANGTADSVVVGRDCFRPDGFMGAIEFADVNADNQAEVYAAGREFMREIIRYAQSRKIKVWMQIGEMPFVLPHLTSTGERLTHFEEMLDIWEAACSSLIETYPEVDRFWVSTGGELLARADPEVIVDYEQFRPLLRDKPRPAQDSDLADIAAADGLFRRIRERHPDVQLGASMIFRGGHLRPLDAVLPKDIAFINMVNYRRGGGEWEMDWFDGIEGRELVVWPRITDDGGELHIQLNATMYERDRNFTDAQRFGLTGVIGQLNKSRGAEQSAAFVAEACWNPQLSAESFYRSYLKRLYGAEALENLFNAFMIMEENEREFGWDVRRVGVLFAIWSPRRGQHFASLRGNVDVKAQHVQVDHNRILRDIGLATERREFALGQAASYRRALELLRVAKPQVLPGSRAELGFVIYKTEQLIAVLDQLAAVAESQIEYDRAILAMSEGNADKIDRHLSLSLTALQRADQLIREACAQMIPFCGYPDERHLLWILNQRIPSHEAALNQLNEAIAFHQTHRRTPVSAAEQMSSSSMWTGLGPNGSWANAGNWGGVIPRFDASLDVVFHQTGAAKLKSFIGNHRQVGTLTFNENVHSPVEVWLSSGTPGDSGFVLVFSASDPRISVKEGATGDIVFKPRTATDSGTVRMNEGDLMITHHGSGNLVFDCRLTQHRKSVGVTKTGSGTVHLNAANTFTGATIIQSGGLVLGPAGSLAGTQLGFGVTDTGAGWLGIENPAFSFSGTLDLAIASVQADGTTWQLFKGSAFHANMINPTAITSDMEGLVFTKKGTEWEASDGNNSWRFNSSTGELSVMITP